MENNKKLENCLRAMFDFHAFEPDSRLQKLIDETEKRYGQALDDDDLLFVNAAGDPGMEGGSDLFPGI